MPSTGSLIILTVAAVGKYLDATEVWHQAEPWHQGMYAPSTQQDLADMLVEVESGVKLMTRGLLQHTDVMVLMRCCTQYTRFTAAVQLQHFKCSKPMTLVLYVLTEGAVHTIVHVC